MSEIQESAPDLPKGAQAEEPISNFEVGQTFDQNGEIKPIDPALVEKLFSLKMIVKLDTLLANCLFPGGAADDLLGAKQFLQKLHTPLIRECEAHPDFVRATKPQGASAAPAVSPVDEEAKKKAAEKRNRKARRTRAN